MAYGCYNREPFKSEVVVQDGWHQPSGDRASTKAPALVKVPFRMSTECQYSQDPMGHGQKDPGCVGCKYQKEPRLC